MSVWMHSRKGRIEGEMIREDETWMQVQLSRIHAPRYFSEANRGRTHDAGDVLTLRKELMQPVADMITREEAEK